MKEKLMAQIQRYNPEPTQDLRCKPDENSGVAWLDMDELAEKAASRGLRNGSIQNW